jgi:hypothetical protein
MVILDREIKMNLPKEVLIPKKYSKSKQYNDITNYLSDKYGFCVNSYSLTQFKNRLYATNIDWDISD